MKKRLDDFKNSVDELVKNATERSLEIRVPKGGKTDEFLEYVEELKDYVDEKDIDVVIEVLEF